MSSLPGAPPPGSARPRGPRPGHPSRGPVTVCSTPGFAGYSLAWSPFFPDRLAVAGSANYGLVGNGRLHLLGVDSTPGTPLPQLSTQKVFDTQDGLYDVAWSEIHENHLVTASGDGSIKLWDTTLHDHPIRNWHEHTREVFSVDWNNIKKDLFVSSSWDASVKIWHPEQLRSLLSLTAHTACVYAALWSPHNPDILATACGDGHLRLFDLRQASSGGVNTPPTPPIATVPVGGEVLSLDWNKYRQWTIATGSTDKTIKVWDLRSVGHSLSTASTPAPPQQPPPPGSMVPSNQQGQLLSLCTGHAYAVRKVAFSPHSPSLLASASYDMSARIWNIDHPSLSPSSVASRLVGTGPSPAGAGGLVKVHDAHTEFVVGLGWALFQEDLIASTAWDMTVQLWPARNRPR